jgi:tRNA (cytidine/uridine-2'-O-)-methyltransferase
MLHIALYQPEIPPNTGSIARQCVGMNANLHIIGPIAFDMSDSAVKRAGLDYWPDVLLEMHESPGAFLSWLDGRQPWLVTKYGNIRYDTADYRDGDIIVFGNENRGLPEQWKQRWPERTVYVPIMGNIRSYNLSNTVSIVLAQANLRAGIFDMKD